MSGKRIVEETPCEHGEFAPHGVTLPNGEFRAHGCIGSILRVLTEGQYVLIEDIHDLLPDAWRVLNATAAFGHPGGSAALWRDLRAALRGDPIPSLDALSDHTEGTP